MNQKNLHKIIQLKPNEEIVAVVHQALAPHFHKFVLAFLLVLLPFFFLFPLFKAGALGILGFLILLASTLYIFGRVFVKWANTVLVITDRRIIDVDQKALFDRLVSEAPFGQIDDVSHRIKGVAPTIFRYGQIKVQMSGNAADIIFSRIKQPARVHDLIQDLRQVIKDEDRDYKEQKLHELAERSSLEEVEAIEQTFRKREMDEGLQELYDEDE
ncbi:hypothetical protein KJ611_03100 [Patescibacteria group bacterium]|nr:hypothetical protein [Patescibacteria group bacterium]